MIYEKDIDRTHSLKMWELIENFISRRGNITPEEQNKIVNHINEDQYIANTDKASIIDMINNNKIDQESINVYKTIHLSRNLNHKKLDRLKKEIGSRFFIYPKEGLVAILKKRRKYLDVSVDVRNPEKEQQDLHKVPKEEFFNDKKLAPEFKPTGSPKDPIEFIDKNKGTIIKSKPTNRKSIDEYIDEGSSVAEYFSHHKILKESNPIKDIELTSSETARLLGESYSYIHNEKISLVCFDLSEAISENEDYVIFPFKNNYFFKSNEPETDEDIVFMELMHTLLDGGIIFQIQHQGFWEINDVYKACRENLEEKLYEKINKNKKKISEKDLDKVIQDIYKEEINRTNIKSYFLNFAKSIIRNKKSNVVQRNKKIIRNLALILYCNLKRYGDLNFFPDEDPELTMIREILREKDVTEESIKKLFYNLDSRENKIIIPVKSHNDTFRLMTNQGDSYFVKIYKSIEKGELKSKKEIEISKYAKKNPLLQELLVENIINIPLKYKGHWLIVKKDITQETSSFLNIEEYMVMLAKFHHGINQKNGLSILFQEYDSQKDFREIYQRAKECVGTQGEIDLQILQKLEKEYNKAFGFIKRTRIELIHNDLKPDNIKGKRIIDTETVGIGHPARDISLLLSLLGVYDHKDISKKLIETYCKTRISLKGNFNSNIQKEINDMTHACDQILPYVLLRELSGLLERKDLNNQFKYIKKRFKL
jgi:hypothetical protein